MYLLIKRFTLLMFFTMSSLVVQGAILHLSGSSSDPFKAACGVDCQFVELKVKARRSGSCVVNRLTYIQGLPQLLRCF